MSNPNKTHDSVGTALQVFKSAIYGELRAIFKEDVIWFVVSDVCRCLEVSEPIEILPKFKSSQVDIVLYVNDTGETEIATLVSESGLYGYIKENYNPNTTAFWGWVSGVVVPTIKENNLVTGGKMSKKAQKQNVGAAAQVLEFISAPTKWSSKESISNFNHTKNSVVREETQSAISTFLQVFQNEEFGILHAGVHEGRAYADAQDLCRMLGTEKNVSKALSRLDADEYTTITLSDSGRPYKKSIVFDSGVLALVLSSRKPFARRLRKWVTSEVLPALFTDGGYLMPHVQQDLGFVLDDDTKEIVRLINNKTQKYKKQIDFLTEAVVIYKEQADENSEYREIVKNIKKMLGGNVKSVTSQPEYLSAKEVAKRLNVSKKTTYRLIKDIENPLPSVNVKGSIRVKTTDLEKYMKKNKYKGFAGE